MPIESNDGIKIDAATEKKREAVPNPTDDGFLASC
jgi:hypothetical protein